MRPVGFEWVKWHSATSGATWAPFGYSSGGRVGCLHSRAALKSVMTCSVGVVIEIWGAL